MANKGVKSLNLFYLKSNKRFLVSLLQRSNTSNNRPLTLGLNTAALTSQRSYNVRSGEGRNCYTTTAQILVGADLAEPLALPKIILRWPLAYGTYSGGS